MAAIGSLSYPNQKCRVAASLAKEVDGLLAPLPGHEMLGGFGTGDDLAAPDDEPAGGPQADGIALTPPGEPNEGGAAAWGSSVVGPSAGAGAADGGHVGQRPGLFLG